MCLATQSLPNALTSQARQVFAFNMVSAVVNVFETTMTKVWAGSKPSKARVASIGSMLAKKRNVRPAAALAQVASVRMASAINSGPK